MVRGEHDAPDLTPPSGERTGANEPLCLLRIVPDADRRAAATARSQGTKQRIHTKAINMTSHAATWTSERVEQLKSCFNAGLSCSQIAHEIGVSRNAVIGKMNRLGLSRPKDLIAGLPKREHAAQSLRDKSLRTKAWRPRLWDDAAAEDPILVAEAPEPSTEVIPDGPGCSLLELSHGTCRWPISQPGDEHFTYCGHAAIEGLPYCPGHARLAYRAGGRQRSGARP
jgi:GcrA cell cycle regulator